MGNTNSTPDPEPEPEPQPEPSSDTDNNFLSKFLRTVKIAGFIAAGFSIGTFILLPILGFGAGGVALGSIAAGIQAGIGNVAAGSLFALCQSVAMGGAAAGTVTAVGVVGGAVAGGVILAERARGMDFNRMVHRVVGEVVRRKEAAAALRSQGKRME